MSIDIIGLAVAVILFALAFYLIRFIPDALIQTVAKIIVVVVAVVYLIGLLTGHQLVHFR